MSSNACILVFSHKPVLEDFERISLRQCQRTLQHQEMFLVHPVGMDIEEHISLAPSLKPFPIPKHWLQNIYSYNRLKVSPFLYDKFRDFQFLLTYELDAFVFRDELAYWCKQGFDYIGAPWFEGWVDARPGAKFIGVGNSGFSLRSVTACQHVLRRLSPALQLMDLFGAFTSGAKVSFPQRIARKFCVMIYGPAINRILDPYFCREDTFWGRDAPKLCPIFNVAPLEAAQRFSWEGNATGLFASSGGTLPFGCHAWHKTEMKQHVANFLSAK